MPSKAPQGLAGIDPRSIVTVWAEHCTGPGWANTPIWVLCRASDGRLDIRAVQPSNCSPEIVALAHISDAVSREMTAQVRALLPLRRARSA